MATNAKLQSVEVIRGPERAAFLLEPTRRRLLGELAEPESAAGLARRLGLPRQRVNYHLRELEREGLIELVEERRKGNCVERRMRATARAFVLSPEALGELDGDPAAGADRASATYALALASRSVREIARLETRARQSGKRLATLSLEAEVRFADADARAAFAEELTSLVARLAAKYHDESAPRGRSFRVVALAHPASAEPREPKAAERRTR